MFAKRLFWTGHLAWHLRGQARYPFRPLEAIRRDQARRVRSMVAYACRHVPYYRETMGRLGLVPSDFRRAEDLAKLPIVERELLQNEPEYLSSDLYPLGNCLRLHTSGTSGTPRDVYCDPRSLFLSSAHNERDRSIITTVIGKRFGYRAALLTMPGCSTSQVRRFCHEHGWFPSWVRVHRLHLSVLDPVPENLARLNEFQPDVFYGYGSYMAMLFAHVEATAAAFHRPKAIVYTAENLIESARRRIAEGFGIPVFSWYQANEAMKIAFECERHTGLHVNIDLCPVRIVDGEGRALPVGESGEIVVSNLVSQATVLLNYRLGDVAALLPEPCPCGRSLPLLSFLPGRSDDLLVLPSGQTLHPVFVHDVLAAQEHVWQYRVVQRAPAHFEITMVVAETCNRPQLAQVIGRRFAEKFGQEVKTDVSFVPSIPLTAGGKHRTVISLVQQDRVALCEADREG